MAQIVRLEDRDIDDLARNVTEGKYREYVRLMLRIAVAERGRAVSIATIEGDLQDLPYLNSGVVTRIVKDMEELYEEQQGKRAA